MKLILLLTVVGLLAFDSLSQTTTQAPAKPKTELEAFQESYGSVMVRGYTQLDPIRAAGIGGGTLRVSVREGRSPSSNARVKGLIVEIDTGERYASSGRSFVEYGEIDSLIKGIEYIAKLDKSVTTLSNFEAEYKTKGDFAITVFSGSSSGKLSANASVGSIGSKSVFLLIEQLPDIVVKLKEAKAILDTLP